MKNFNHNQNGFVARVPCAEAIFFQRAPLLGDGRRSGGGDAAVCRCGAARAAARAAREFDAKSFGTMVGWASYDRYVQSR